MADILALKELAQRDPSALSPDGWRRLAEAPGVDIQIMGKAVTTYPEFLADNGWLQHPSGYLVSGPGSADVIRAASGGGASTGSSALDLCLRRYKRFYNMPPLRLWDGPQGDVEASEAVESDAVYTLLHNPHPDLTLRDLRSLLVACEFVEGNAYLIKLRAGGGTILDNVRGMVEELHPVAPTRMRPARDKGSNNLIDYYALDLGDGKSARVPKENVIHFRDELDPKDPAKGIGIVKRLAREVATDAETDAFVQTYMRNMGVPGLVFAPKELSKGAPIDVDQLQNYVKASTTGSNRGKPLVFKTPVDFYQMDSSTGVLDLSHVTSHVETRIAGMVGIPAILAGLAAGLDATSYGANTRALVEAFIENELMAVWDQHGERWTNGLRDDFGFSPTQWLGYDWTGLRALQDDADKRTMRYTRMWTVNAINAGQFHAALDMELPAGADPDARAADFSRPAAKPAAPGDVIDAVPIAGALPKPGPTGADMSAARLEVLQRVAERVAAGQVSVDAAVAQLMFGFGVDDATARRLIGQAVAVVEDGGDVTKAWVMPPFAVKAEGWKPPGGGGSLTGDELALSKADIVAMAGEAVEDWAEWLAEGDDSDLAGMLDTEAADHGRGKAKEE